jgi:DNA-binding transcriptional LysR family regulator
VRGIGCGFLPHFMVDVYVQAGLLVTRQVARPSRNVRVHYAWSGAPQQAPARALQWWLQQLESPATRRALMENHHRH